MLGCKTIGNATLIAFEDIPILATDPWLGEGAYFGSWTLSHPIPQQEKDEILACQYVWFSHGHPDHLNGDSLAYFKNAQILLPDHYGKRIYSDLLEQGYQVSILPNREWVQLSKNIKVFCISDYFQDSILLVDINGHLFVNLNDANDRGWGKTVRSIVNNYKNTYLLKLSGYGDADMINFFTESGERILPDAAKKRSVGSQLTTYLKLYRCNHVIPFSSFHTYQRADSIWANEYTTPASSYTEGFDYRLGELLSPFQQIDCVTGEISSIKTVERESLIYQPAEFGDDWSETLDKKDLELANRYFSSKERLAEHFGFINLKVGGEDNYIVLNSDLKTGITFECPRNSLVTAMSYEIFDDLLIGNFMKTTLHNVDSLYPNFTPVVCKFSDNGRAQTEQELAQYFKYYRQQSPMEYIFHCLERDSEQIFRRFFTKDSLMFKIAKQSYVFLKSRSK